MRYDLIISDYDGTFRHRDNTVGAVTVNAVKKYTARGGKFVICTGRMPCSIRPVLLRLGFGGVYVAYQGSLVGEVQSGRFLHESGFTKEQAIRICRIMEEMNLKIHAYDRDVCYVNYSDKQLAAYEEICGVKSTFVADMGGMISSSGKKFFKLLAMTEKEKRNDVCDGLRRALGEGGFFVSCSASTLVEVTSVNDTKGAAAKFLRDYYGAEQSRVLAFGDNQNDTPLLAECGHGVAVFNADEGLKRVADEVSPLTCDEDAVGRYIEEFVL